MPHDALDDGGDGTFPHMPRLPDGTVDPVRFPTGPRTMRDPTTGKRIVVDVTPAIDDQPLPTIPPTP